jgi:hypothetical protein
MFRALLAHPQEVLQKRHLVYCVSVMSSGCATVAVLTTIVTQTIDVTRTQCTKCRLCGTS